MSRALEPINLHIYPSLRISVRASFRDDTARYALLFVEHYLNGLVEQWNRISDGLDGGESRVMNERGPVTPVGAMVLSQLGDRVDLDVHLFLICWDNVGKFLRLFARAQKDPAIGVILREVNPLLVKAKDGRGYFEHLDERLSKGNGRTRGFFAGGDSQLRVSYEVKYPPGERREADFGREELRRLFETYVRILEHLGARIEHSHMGELLTV